MIIVVRSTARADGIGPLDYWIDRGSGKSWDDALGGRLRGAAAAAGAHKAGVVGEEGGTRFLE